MTNLPITQVVAYYRISTGAQEKSGLGIEAQQDYVKAAASSQGWEIVAEYTETVSGTVAPLDRQSARRPLPMAYLSWLQRLIVSVVMLSTLQA